MVGSRGRGVELAHAGQRQAIQQRRRAAERLLTLAEHLPAQDRLLLEQVYRNGLSVAEVAHLMGARPRRLQRRVAQLLRRLRDPLFRFVVGRSDLLPRDVQPTARLVVIEGRSLRDAARARGRSLHAVREQVRTLRTLAQVM
ncbi:MAG: hypothetical protein WD316_05705 [Phycisphaeraceae bacterium]